MMKELEEKVITFIEENGLIKKGSRVLCALSGGPDSVFMTSVLLKYRKRFNITIAAAHLNHKLREGADEDTAFCREFSKKHGIEFYAEENDVALFAIENKLSAEQAGRELRYRFFNKISDDHGYDLIATGHNIDDNAETVLLNLFKGAGLQGITGIPVRRGRIIRPILPVAKKELIEYLKINDIPYCLDRTNFRPVYQRNILRMEIIPAIKENLNPNLEQALFHFSKLNKSLYQFVEKELIDKLWQKAAGVKEEGVKIELEAIKDQPEFLTGEVFRRAMRESGVPAPVYSDFEKLQDLTGRQKGRRIQLSGGIIAVRESTDIVFTRELSVFEDELIIKPGERISAEDTVISITEVKPDEAEFGSDRLTEYISGEDTDDEFLIRRWHNGDSFQPLGMEGTKKVSDFLTDEKVPSLEKHGVKVLVNRDRIVWVIGYRTDDRFKVTDKSKKIFRLKAEEPNG